MITVARVLGKDEAWVRHPTWAPQCSRGEMAAAVVSKATVQKTYRFKSYREYHQCLGDEIQADVMASETMVRKDVQVRSLPGTPTNKQCVGSPVVGRS